MSLNSSKNTLNDWIATLRLHLDRHASDLRIEDTWGNVFFPVGVGFAPELSSAYIEAISPDELYAHGKRGEQISLLSLRETFLALSNLEQRHSFTDDCTLSIVEVVSEDAPALPLTISGAHILGCTSVLHMGAATFNDEPLEEVWPLTTFQIRLQNGNTIIVQASDEQQALDAAGISDLSAECDFLRDPALPREPEAELLWNLVEHAGLGLQNCTIRPLKRFMLDCKLNDDGTFALALADDDAIGEFNKDYPALEMVPDGPQFGQMMGEAVEIERRRLTALYHPDQDDAADL